MRASGPIVANKRLQTMATQRSPSYSAFGNEPVAPGPITVRKERINEFSVDHIDNISITFSNQ